MTDRGALAAEQRDLATFLADLEPDAWQRPSLCSGWTVRDVVAHLVAWDERLVLPSLAAYPGRLLGLAGRYARARGSTDRTNEQLLGLHRTTAETALVARLERAAASPRRLFDRLAPDAQLAELVVHHQDIRRGLGRPRAVPDDRLVRALHAVGRLPGVGARRRTRGARLVATDVAWSRGTGPEVRGPGEAILLTIAGRDAALAELTGPGLAALGG